MSDPPLSPAIRWGLVGLGSLVAATAILRAESCLSANDRSRWATAFFITSADRSTNGSCICPLANCSPTTFIPSSRWSLTMSRGFQIPSASSSDSA